MSVVPIEILVWTPEYSLCVPELDREAQFGFHAINQHHAAMLAGNGKETLAKVLSRNVRFGSDHTAHQEELMAAIDYPGLREHSQEHEEIRRKNEEFLKRLERGETTITIEHSLFLSRWVEEHINTSDRRLAEYLRIHESASAIRGLFARRRQGALRIWQPSP